MKEYYPFLLPKTKKNPVNSRDNYSGIGGASHLRGNDKRKKSDPQNEVWQDLHGQDGRATIC